LLSESISQSELDHDLRLLHQLLLLLLPQVYLLTPPLLEMPCSFCLHA
jgi:hypothetical protein